MSEPVITGLFPTPIMISNIGRDFTPDEMEQFYKYSESLRMNEGNGSSMEDKVLDDNVMVDLKQVCLDYLREFIEKVYDPISEVDCYITQSWLNFTQKGEYHHLHNHPNSLLSGVLYIKASSEHDSISFINETSYTNITFFSKLPNHFSNENILKVKTGDLLIFPSLIKHRVNKKEDDNLRVSLSFNTYFKGTAGDKNNFNELVLT